MSFAASLLQQISPRVYVSISICSQRTELYANQKPNKDLQLLKRNCVFEDVLEFSFINEIGYTIFFILLEYSFLFKFSYHKGQKLCVSPLFVC